jgi:hypothetical protein
MIQELRGIPGHFKEIKRMSKWITIEVMINSEGMDRCPATNELIYSQVKDQVKESIESNNFSFSFQSLTNEDFKSLEVAK